jgi:quercetin dioxygenase-like cupin family protein
MFHEIQDIPEREIVPGYFARFVHSERMTLAWWRVKAGSVLPEHTHPHEQVANVLEGTYELDVNGTKKRLGPGQPVVIPGGVRHGGVAITDCILLDVFAPVREEYKL